MTSSPTQVGSWYASFAGITALTLILGGCSAANPEAVDNTGITGPADTAQVDAKCPDLDSQYGGDVTVWRAPSGDCIPVEVVFEFACSPGATGWISLGGTDTSDPAVRQYVPADIGLPAADLPPDAEPLQATNGERELYVSPSEPEALFVVTPDEYQRWVRGIAACG